MNEILTTLESASWFLMGVVLFLAAILLEESLRHYLESLKEQTDLKNRRIREELSGKIKPEISFLPLHERIVTTNVLLDTIRHQIELEIEKRELALQIKGSAYAIARIDEDIKAIALGVYEMFQPEIYENPALTVTPEAIFTYITTTTTTSMTSTMLLYNDQVYKTKAEEEG